MHAMSSYLAFRMALACHAHHHHFPMLFSQLLFPLLANTAISTFKSLRPRAHEMDPNNVKSEIDAKYSSLGFRPNTSTPPVDASIPYRDRKGRRDYSKQEHASWYRGRKRKGWKSSGDHPETLSRACSSQACPRASSVSHFLFYLPKVP